MRRVLLLPLLTLGLAFPAAALPVSTKDGRFSAEVSASELNRLTIPGERIVKIRLMGEAQGAPLLVEADDQTGDAFIGFQGEVSGRVFSAYFITESGRTVQGVFSPHDGPAQTIVLTLPANDRAAQPASVPDDGAAAPAPAAGEGRGRQEAYPEVLTALVRVMFNGAAPEGVQRVRVNGQPRRAGPFELVPLEIYSVDGLKGTVLSLKNLSKVGQPLTARPFLREGVLAAAVSHEQVEPGRYARVYLVEAAR